MKIEQRSRIDHRPKCSGTVASALDQLPKPDGLPSLLDVLSRSNMQRAMRRVISNKGAAGSDGMTVEELPEHLKEHWPSIRSQLLEGTYKPKPVRVVYIPKPKGGERMLGIPCVVDRLIQQAISQTLSDFFDPTFSDSSFGFRPRRNAHQAIQQAKRHQSEGLTTTVDIDLEKFFDRVNHDVLMGIIGRQLKDPSLLRLIRRYLNTGMMTEGLYVKREVGTPQGSPLSPLLSNIMLDVFDKELERRGLKFCRYADDCNVYVGSQRAGRRVLMSLTSFLEDRLRLKVNAEKSGVRPSWKCNFLGYSFLGAKNPRIRCSTESIERLKDRVRQITRGHDRSKPMERRLEELNTYLRGWCGYFRLAETHRKFADIDGWIRSRLRMCRMKQWFKPRTRIREMMKLGLPREEAIGYGRHKRWWFYAQLHQTRFFLNDKYWEDLGFIGITGHMRRLGNT